jgi:hypothetical protein
VVGELEKIKIQAFKEPDCPASGKINEFTAYINPAEITLSYEMEYDSAQGSGTTASRMEFKKVKPGDLSLTFFIDGTKVTGQAVDSSLDVQQQVELFQTVTGFNGEIHRPNYLLVIWGTLQVKRCVLKSASIAYKMFQPNGIPMRAVITAVFTDSADDTTRVALEQRSSPDLTHSRLVKAGDNLPALCNAIYGSPDHYYAVARANRLTNFRQLTPGRKIFFPPLEK